MDNTHNPYQIPDTKLDNVNNEIVITDDNYASRGERLLGAILDGLAVGIPSAVIFFLVIDDELIQSYLIDANIILVIIVTVLMSVALYLVVHGYFMYKNAQTLGKYLLGMQVVALNGKPISGNHYLFKRFLPIFAVENIPAIGGLVALVNVLLIFRKEHNCLHDDIARTRVISLKSYNDDIPVINTEINDERQESTKLEASNHFVDYTFADLVSALDAIDQEQYPDRALNLKKEINYRKQEKKFN